MVDRNPQCRAESEGTATDVSDAGTDLEHERESSDCGGTSSSQHDSTDVEDGLSRRAVDEKQSSYVLPLASVLFSASVGFLTFLSSAAGSANAVRDLASTMIARKTEIVYNQAFQWLVAVASVASLQSWAGMLFTYIRWHKGTEYVEKSCAEMSPEDAQAVREQIKVIKKNRSWGQPYLAYYAFGLCIVVLFTNGWAVFVHSGWRIADVIGDNVPQYDASQKESNPVSQFLSAYVPIVSLAPVLSPHPKYRVPIADPTRRPE
ncbi:hypothetical protein NUW54_g4526 [Trametes sanguinea]|uniref:Uncharacterized protein n=1 Tax=Trametes sanguinea TaxID=158606 RepID=A0ACC1Q0G4_9APHY|nr:hypothetical protein NUW54_g4526 [Trametes sanguinea]